MTSATRTAFIGLGIMGSPMSGHLATAGHPVTGCDFAHAKSGALIIDFSSIHPDVTVDLAEQARDRGFRYLDAPVSGGEAGSAVRECSARGPRGSRAAVGKQRAHSEGDDA